jgi:glycosyltransferase involved in cell wall biosynthesis
MGTARQLSRREAMKPVIVHVADVRISEETGMGRVAWHWRRACEDAGWEFVHLGPDEVGPVAHPALFPRAAWRTFRQRSLTPALFLVHEPSGALFAGRGVRLVVFSHGLERRGWDLARRGEAALDEPLRWRTRLCFPFWRLRGCDGGLRRANAVFLINEDDARYAARRYAIGPERRWIFNNGVSPVDQIHTSRGDKLRILFLGNWLARKGTRTLSQAAAVLHGTGQEFEWILAGVGRSKENVLAEWPRELAAATKVIPHFTAGQENTLLADSDIFVLPSYFEGQPLALLQAMAAGRCCITTECCGQRDMITHRRNGLLHAPGDREALVALITESARDAQFRNALGESARLSVAGRSWPIVSAQVAKQLASVWRLGKLDPQISRE